MIVISIIGVLAAALFPVMTGYFERSRMTALKSDVQQITSIIKIISSEIGKSIFQITRNNCSDCSCRGWVDVRPWIIENVPSCANPLRNLWNKITEYGMSRKNPWLDPWGGVYLMDENFWESPWTCVHDVLMSAWQNHKRENWAPNPSEPGIYKDPNGDDYNIPLEFPQACP